MYGKFEPALGCVVESYEHKQQLLKEQNVMEAHDLVGGSRMYRVPDPPPEDLMKVSGWTIRTQRSRLDVRSTSLGF